MHYFRIGMSIIIAVVCVVAQPVAVFADMIDVPVATDMPEVVAPIIEEGAKESSISALPEVIVPPRETNPPAIVPTTLEVAPSPSEPLPVVTPVSRVVITEVRLGGSAISAGGVQRQEYITVTNISEQPVMLDGWKVQHAIASFLRTGCVGESWSREKLLTGTLDHGQSMVVDISMANTAAGSVRIVDSQQVVHDMVGWGMAAPCFETAPVATIPANDMSLVRMAQCDGTYNGIDTDNNSADFVVGVSQQIVLLPECTIPPDPPIVNSCEGLHLSEIGANRDEQFIEIHNPTDHAIDGTGCQLQTNRSVSAAFIFSDDTIEAGGYRTINIKDTVLTLTKTTTGTVYLLSSDGATEVDGQTYSNLASGTSWARFADGWRQTYAPTPGSDNSDMVFLPCAEGYVRNETTSRCNKMVSEVAPIDCGEGKYRSEETGRCRVIPAASVLAACKLGQYRSEETNRCRNLVSASSQVPCKENQYRSEETNRCRTIVTASATLKPCRDNQYRSEETNRCRTLPSKAVPAAAYAVTPVRDSAKAFVGWWVLGGIMIVAVGYAAWEWRSELRDLLRSSSIHKRH